MFKFCCEDCGECWYVGNPRTCKCPNEELQQPKQEQVKPVAWGMEKDGVILDVICPDEHEREEGEYTIPVYTQPQRTWVGLTDEEMRELEKQFEAERVSTSDEEYLVIYPAAYWQWQRAIEAKLKEKNT